MGQGALTVYKLVLVTNANTYYIKVEELIRSNKHVATTTHILEFYFDTVVIIVLYEYDTQYVHTKRGGGLRFLLYYRFLFFLSPMKKIVGVLIFSHL